MKTNFKETLVNWSRSKSLKRFCWIIAIIGILIFIFTKSKIVAILAYIGVLAIGILATWMAAVKQQKEGVIKSNKLIYIILSDYDVIFFPVWFLVILPLFYLCGNMISGFIMSGIVVLVVVMLLHKLSKKVSNHFKKKLIIPKEEE